MNKINPYYLFLKKLFKELRVTANKLVIDYDMPGLSSTLTKLKHNPNAGLHPETIHKIEKALNIKIDDSDPENITYEKIEKTNKVKLLGGDMLINYPIISHIYKGLSMQSLLKENITGYVVLPYNKKENCYAILITDNSMAQKIEQGDIVLADMDEKVANDSIVIAVLKDGRQIVRRYREVAQNIVLLLADNNDYPVLTINKSDIEVIHAIVGTWKTFRKG